MEGIQDRGRGSGQTGRLPSSDRADAVHDSGTDSVATPFGRAEFREAWQDSRLHYAHHHRKFTDLPEGRLEVTE